MRYRMLDVRIWCDAKFRALGPLKPSGQALFIYLLTNPNTTSIPGLYRAGAAAMAEELGWSLHAFNRALKEVIAQGLAKVDLKARVIFIGNAIKYNKPQSPNVVKSWALHWDEIPECQLKQEAYQALKHFIQSLGKAFSQAFDESLGKKASQHQSIGCKACLNQEQEQEQEQDQEQENEVNEVFDNSFESFSPSKVVSLMDSNETKLINSDPCEEAVVKIPLRDSSFYSVSNAQCQRWQMIYTAIDISYVLQQLLQWNVLNSKKRKPRASILRHIHTWFAKAQAQKIKNPSSAYIVTFEHNLAVAKRWINEISSASEKVFEFGHLISGKVA